MFDDKEKPCKPRKNIVFLKTHKTGSSTMTNILNRFAEKHNLTMALPQQGSYNFLWPLLFQRDFVDDVTSKPDILANHARFDAEPFQELMPSDTQFITILRNPITQFPSLFKFMDLGSALNFKSSRQQISLEYFLNNSYNILRFLNQHNSKILIDNPALFLLRNPQLFDLGFDQSLSEDENSVREKIASIDNHFKLVLIMEYFDESLVLLKRKMCWDLDDMVYFKHNKQIGRRHESSANLQKNILRWTKADVSLYNYFNKSFWDDIRREGPDLWEEVNSLRQKNKELTKTCLKEGISIDKPYAGSTALIYGHSLKSDIPPHLKRLCLGMVRSEMSYLDYFRTIYKTKSG